jgi:hypothetical protein
MQSYANAALNHGPRSLEPLIGEIVRLLAPDTNELAGML